MNETHIVRDYDKGIETVSRKMTGTGGTIEIAGLRFDVREWIASETVSERMLPKIPAEAGK